MTTRDPFKLPTTDARIHENDHDAAVTRVARRILAGVPFEGANPADLRRALAGRDRHLFDEALRRLTWGQRVEVVETWNGERLVVPVYALDGLDAPGILRDALDEVARLSSHVRRLDDTLRDLLRTAARS